MARVKGGVKVIVESPGAKWEFSTGRQRIMHIGTGFQKRRRNFGSWNVGWAVGMGLEYLGEGGWSTW